MSAGYAAAAALYQSKGWHPLPLLNGKGLVPPGFTGYAARYPTDAEVAEWCQEYPDNGLCLRLGYEIGLDVDDYDTKAHAAGEGTRSLAALEREYGALPQTWVSSGRFASGDMGSGIRYYRLPERFHELAHERVWHGRPAIEGTMLPGIDVIRLGHRQAVVNPTVHKSGYPYQWLNQQTGQIRDDPPALDDIPFLPEAWLEALVKRPGTGKKATPKAARQRRQASPPLSSEWWTDGEPCRAVAEALDKWTIDLGSGRHEAMTRGMTALTRLGEQGHHGVAQAIDTFKAEFLAAVAGEEGRFPESEWERAVEGVDLLLEDEGLTPDEDRGCCVEQPLAGPPTLPPGFWQARDSLRRIRQAARSEAFPADALLGAVLARVSWQTDHRCRLPGARTGTLDLLVNLVGESGDGKGTALDLSARLVPDVELASCLCGDPDHDGMYVEVPAGTGEGVTQAFYDDVADKDSGRKRGRAKLDRRHVLIRVDEGQAITALNERSGATIVPLLRQAFSGEGLGFQYSSNEKRRKVPARQYRLAVVMCVQPTLAAPLFDDVDGGTPQRLLWLSLMDPSLVDLLDGPLPPWPGPLIEDGHDQRGRGDAYDFDSAMWVPNAGFAAETDCVMHLATEVQEEIKGRLIRRRAGQLRINALDAHRDLLRLKVAGLLARLDGLRTDITAEDWRLAGMVMDTSDGVRQWALERIKAEQRQASGKRTEAAVQRERAVAEDADAVQRVAYIIARRVAKLEQAKRKDLREAVASRDRQYAKAAIERAVSQRLIIEDDNGGYLPGEAKPPDGAG